MKLLPKLVMTGLGTGYLRPAPGTWGSLGACVVFLAVSRFTNCAISLNAAMLVVLIVSCVGCVAFGPWAEKEFGKKDPSQCTVDEWAGQSVALLLLPAIGGLPIYWSVLVAFLSFRVFDIVKPPPARQFERLPAGWGILMDDLAAGVYANIFSQVAIRWLIPMAIGAAG